MNQQSNPQPENKPFTSLPNENLITKFKILESSTFNERTKTWQHECGTQLNFEKVHRLMLSNQVEVSAIPGTRIFSFDEPYCGDCQDKPARFREPIHIEDVPGI